MLEDRFKEQIPAINHKLSHLQQIVDSTKSGLANVERINLGLVKQQDPKLVAMQSKAQEKLLKDEEELELLEKEKAELERKVHDAKEAWFEFAWNVCVHHHIAFIKAGFKGEGGDSEDGERSSAESEPGEEASGAKESERKSSPTAAKEAQQPVAGNEMAMVLYTGNNAKQDTTIRNADVPQSKPPDLTMTRFTAEDEIRLKLRTAKKAFNKADDAHDNHRKCYELSFLRYCAQYPTKPEAELAAQFPLYFIRKGQELINALRVAEKAYHEAENRALDANVFTIPDERIEANVNPYLDLDDLDAKLMPWTDKDRARIYNWRHVEAGVLTPPSIHTIDTFYDASCSEDDDNTESVVSAQDIEVQRIEAAQPSAPSANNNVDTIATTPAQNEAGPRSEEHDIPEGVVLLTKPVASQNSYSSTELASTIDGAASSEVVEKLMPLSDFQIPDSVEGLQAALSNVDEDIHSTEDKEREQARIADDDLRLLGAKRLAIRMLLLSKRDQQCREAIQEIPNAVLEKLPRELRDMIYTELYRGSQAEQDEQDEPYEIVDNSSEHPHDPLYEFAPMVKAYEPPYWMLEREVGPEFAREAVEIWYKLAYLAVDIKLLQPLLQDDDGVLYDIWSPSVRTCDFIRKLDVDIGPALLPLHTGRSRPSGRAVHIRQVCRSLSTLLEDPSVARKEGFKLHIAFQWDISDDWSDYLKAICPVVYRLKAQGFLVSGSQDYGERIRHKCFQAGCPCEFFRFGDTDWESSHIDDWFDCSEEECMKRIEEERERHWDEKSQ
ncbi:hypothetical protein J4E93_007180 [Alternaria ventricosa]|uniref:uncharacterized protein n=1 Tax=Alternaria ventricosa TaxID=1187951 RepID=UPI0020C1E66A|nr:uncharacterized protein J4E93_007180 [Alternaria ventricosa]KAI4643111.1 hypothetical protein J4E93_007180 [Alternaria ventricosa]